MLPLNFNILAIPNITTFKLCDWKELNYVNYLKTCVHLIIKNLPDSPKYGEDLHEHMLTVRHLSKINCKNFAFNNLGLKNQLYTQPLTKKAQQQKEMR